jgi:hypothetical protein
LDDPNGSRSVRSPGFKVEKHNDGKSVRLFHVTAGDKVGVADRSTRLSLARSQMQKLLAYESALEREGFARVAVEGRDRLAPLSLWRRVDGSHRL